MQLASRLSTMADPSGLAAGAADGTHPPGGELVVERLGRHLLIRHRAENPWWERSILAACRVPPGDVVVLASAAAHRIPVLPAFLPTVLARVWQPNGVAGVPPRIDRIWLAVSGVGDRTGSWSAWLWRLAEQAGVEVLAPRGQLALVPGGTLFVGSDAGGCGWLRYRVGAPSVLVTMRYPVPAWDSALPREPVTSAGLAADPVPAGLAVRPASAAPVTSGDLAFAVPAHGQHPRLILGRPGEPPLPPDAVAALVSGLRPAVRKQLLVVPTAAEMAGPHWVRALVDRLGHDVLLSTGMPIIDHAGVPWTIVFDEYGEQAFRPFATVLRKSPGVSTVEIVDVAPAPAGWSRCGPRLYRPDERDSVVRAEVVPSGIVLRPASADVIEETSVFDPLRWTITVGTPGAPVADSLLTGAERLLAGLTQDQLRAARVVVAGNIDDRGLVRLAELAAQHDAAFELPPLPPPRARAEPTTDTTGGVAEMYPLATVSAPPVAATLKSVVESALRLPAVESAGPAELAEPAQPEEPAQTEKPAQTKKPATAVEPAGPDEPARSPSEDVEAPSVEVADRQSTAQEQASFAEHAAAAFTEALATVNAALAMWPALRRTDLQGAKADYAAVCLYLGQDRGGAVRLNAALRAGRSVPLPGLLPCLVSGLRRLPTQRGPVVRQGTLDGPALRSYPVGAVLTETAFLSASAFLDVSVVGANVDFLIWSRSARRTSVLGTDRPVPEVVFGAGTHLKVLAVRTSADNATDLPGTTVLLRELLPTDVSAPARLDATGLDVADRDVLAKLDRALAARRDSPTRMFDDPDLVARLAGSLVGVGHCLGSSGPAVVADRSASLRTSSGGESLSPSWS